MGNVTVQQLEEFADKWVDHFLGERGDELDDSSLIDLTLRALNPHRGEMFDDCGPIRETPYVFLCDSPVHLRQVYGAARYLFRELGRERFVSLSQEQLNADIAALGSSKALTPSELTMETIHDNEMCGFASAGWAAYTDAGRKLYGLKEATEEVKELVELHKHVYSVMGVPDGLFVIRRPEKVSLSPNGELHHPSEPALKFRDGTGVAAINGTVVPCSWVEDPSSIDPREAIANDNTERRIAAAQLIGWAKVLDMVGATVIAEDEWGILLEADLGIENVPPKRFVRGTCGTGRNICILVGDEHKTPLEEIAASYHVTPEQYVRIQTRT